MKEQLNCEWAHVVSVKTFELAFASNESRETLNKEITDCLTVAHATNTTRLLK